jgi:hypothetical protein
MALFAVRMLTAQERRRMLMLTPRHEGSLLVERLSLSLT